MKTIIVLGLGILIGVIPLATFLTTLFFMANGQKVSYKPYLALLIAWVIDITLFICLSDIHHI